MSDDTAAAAAPELYVKCLRTKRRWWTEGRRYRVQDDKIYDDDSTECRWPISTLKDSMGQFIFVWLLPDGTELEALE